MSYIFEVRINLESWAALGAAFVITLYLLHRLALPRPLPDIPYNAVAARSLLGDLPAISSYLGKGHNTLITYFNDTVISLNAPLVQLFLKPLGTPTLLLSDFNETRRMLMRPTEFDRSPALKDLVLGLVPDHHIHLKTDAAWRAQRQQIQDLMKPSFLKDIAGPIIHESMVGLMDAWVVKCRIANGRPWSAGADIRNVALDAMVGFAFGPEVEHNATRSMLEVLNGRKNKEDDDTIEQAESRDEPIDLLPGRLSYVLQAMLDLTETVMEIHGSPTPYLKWAYVNRKPRIKKATRCKEQYIAQHIQDALTRMKQAPPGDASWVTSATDQVVLGESTLADRDGRPPKYFSRIIFDELFGIVFAGGGTTATTLCWLVKFLTDHADAQRRLRDVLQRSFQQANAETRDPTVQEIIGTRIPYLDATVEEVLRCACTSPFVDRQATVDTELLGYHVPQGTIVLALLGGPSMMSPAFDIKKPRQRQASKQQGQAETFINTSSRIENKTWDPSNISNFLPARWLVPDGNDSDEQRFDPNVGPQLAFGLGPRACFGRRSVYMELRIFLALLCWRFELLQCPSALSSYDSELRTTNEPRQCYLRLRDMRTRRETT